MYLNDGREIYESDKFPGYYIEANTGNFCDEQGNLIGGNQDLGDKPGRQGAPAIILDVPDYVYISKRGKLYYPKANALAKTPIRLEEAEAKGYKPSRGYTSFVEKLAKKVRDKQKATTSKSKKK